MVEASSISNMGGIQPNFSKGQLKPYYFFDYFFFLLLVTLIILLIFIRSNIQTLTYIPTMLRAYQNGLRKAKFFLSGTHRELLHQLNAGGLLVNIFKKSHQLELSTRIERHIQLGRVVVVGFALRLWSVCARGC